MTLVKRLFMITVLFGAQAVTAAEEIPATLMDAVHAMLPGVEPERVVATPVPGIYEVSFGPRVVYLTGNGRYMFRGDLVDLKARRNITEDARRQARLVAIGELGEASMIVFAPEKVKHTVTVFTDVDCPYCARLHRQMADYNRLGIKVRYLAFPRAGIPSPSYTKTVSVWCSDDPRKAIGDAKAGKAIPARSCANPVRDHYVMGQAIGVAGTPAIILESGDLVPGYVPAKELARILADRTSG